MRPQGPIRQVGVLAAISGLLFAACGAASTPAPTAAPSQPAGSSAASAAPSAAQGALPKPELSSITLGISAGSEMSQFAPIFAVQQKIFDKYGITAKITAFEGDAKAVSALQAGQVDIAFTGVASAISSQLTDVPFVVTSVSATVLTDDLICQSAIKTAADVKGKKVAISTFGGTSHASALLALKALGLGATDAVITQIGGESTRVAALKGKSIDCAIVDKVLEPDMTASGFNIVASIWKPPTQPYGRSGMDATSAFIKKNPNTVLVATAAVLEAQNMIWTQNDQAAQGFATYAQIKLADAQVQAKDFMTVGQRSMQWKDEAFTNAEKVIATVNPDIIDVDVKKAFDRSYLQKLVDNGFYAKIGNPSTTP